MNTMNTNIEKYLEQIEQALGLLGLILDNAIHTNHNVATMEMGVLACDNIRQELSTQAEHHKQQMATMLQKVTETGAELSEIAKTISSKASKVLFQQLADSQKYEGWSNYETWAYWNWVNDDDGQKWHDDWLGQARRKNVVGLKGMLKSVLEAHQPKSEHPTYNFLLQHSIDRINFTEIAEKLIAEARDGGVE